MFQTIKQCYGLLSYRFPAHLNSKCIYTIRIDFYEKFCILVQNCNRIAEMQNRTYISHWPKKEHIFVTIF